MLLTSGWFNIATNYMSNNCSSLTDPSSNSDSSEGNSVYCVADWVTIFSLANKTNNKNINTIQHYLNFICLIAVILFMLYHRKQQKELFLQVRWKEITPADYTIAIKNLPNNIGIKELEINLKDFFQTINPLHAYDVQNISFCYDLTERNNLFKTYELLLKSKRALVINKGENYEEKLQKLENDISIKKEEIKDYDLNLEKNNLKFCGIAFVTFNTPKEKKEVTERSRLTLLDKIKIFFNKNVSLPRGFFFMGSRLIIESAPQPNEIIFQNLHTNIRDKIKRRLITLVLTLFELGIFGVIIYYLLLFQNNYFSTEINDLEIQLSKLKSEQSESLDLEDQYYSTMILLYLYSGCISLFIVIINSVLVNYLTKIIVNLEHYSTYTRKKVSLSIRLSLV